MAACGGLLLGYDNGVTGGVVSLESFEQKVGRMLPPREAISWRGCPTSAADAKYVGWMGALAAFW